MFHVGITRAIESLTIVAGHPPSPFIAELTTDPTPVRAGATSAATRPVPVTPSAAKVRAKEGVDGPLADALRALRQELRDGKPAYTVFDDETLRAIVAGRPSTLAELGRIKGIGPKRLDLYGARILAIVAPTAKP